MSRAFVILDRICVVILTSILSAIMLFSAVQVVLRYVFQTSITWSIELVVYLFIYLIMLGSGYSFGKKNHIFVDFFINLFPKKPKKIVLIFNEFVSSVFMLFLVIYGTNISHHMYQLNVTTPTMQIPTFYIYMSIPIGGLIGLIYILRNLYEYFTTDEVEVKGEAEQILEEFQTIDTGEDS